MIVKTFTPRAHGNENCLEIYTNQKRYFPLKKNTFCLALWWAYVWVKFVRSRVHFLLDFSFGCVPLAFPGGRYPLTHTALAGSLEKQKSFE